jgi:hypothetical protein
LRVSKVKSFARWARKSGVSDDSLGSAVREIRAGLVDGDPGGNVFKKRIAAREKGKRSGARVVLAFQKGANLYSIFGVSKNEKENIDENELKALEQYAKQLLELKHPQIEELIESKDLVEVHNDE